MKKIKIKKVYTFWWKTIECREDPKLIVGEMSLGRPTVVFPLLNGEYLYIDAYRIKEMMFCTDPTPMEGDNGIQDDGGKVPTSTE